MNDKTVTLPREVARRLLLCFECHDITGGDIDTLRTALDAHAIAPAMNEAADELEAAQPVVSLQPAHDSVTIDLLNDRVMQLLREKGKLIETVDELRDELQEVRETPKPPSKVHASAGDYLRNKAALKAQPAPQVPMTDDELEELYWDHSNNQIESMIASGWINFARAIEAHHKIGVKP